MIKHLLLCLGLALSFCSYSQQDSTKSARLANLNAEIANLTRTPLGEEDLILKDWVVFTVTERGKTRTGRMQFATNDTSFIWFDNIERSNSYFFRASNSSPIITIIPGVSHGTQLTDEMMVAMGYSNDNLQATPYSILKDAPVMVILDRECTAATSELTEENTDVTTLWVCEKGDLKKSERELLRKAINAWCSNQTSHTRIKSATISEKWNVLGVDEDGFEFRIVEWGFESDMVIALDKIMINIPGRDIKQVAKEHYEKFKEEGGNK